MEKQEVIDNLNSIAEQHFFMSMRQMLDDEGGCYLANRSWMSPKKIALAMIDTANLATEEEIIQDDFPA